MSFPIRWCDDPHQRLELGSVTTEAGHGQVVDEGVVPHVEHVPAVPGHGHAPRERRPCDRHVAQAASNETQGLVAFRNRAHEVGVAVVMVEQPLLEPAQLEEVIVLLHLHHGTAVHGALPVEELLLGVVILARDAVEARVGRQLDVPVVVNALQELLHHGVVAGLGRSDEVVVGDFENTDQVSTKRAEVRSVHSFGVMAFASAASTIFAV